MSAQPDELNIPAQPQSQPAVSWLNWGALVLTPYWLFRNGFWVSFAVYLCLALWIWPLEILMRLLFFFCGTRWSWGDGRRWRAGSAIWLARSTVK